MPIWLRKFTLHKMNEFYEKQNSDPNEDKNSIIDSKGNVNIPSFLKGKSNYK